MTRHGKDCPSPVCSQCVGVQPQRVSVDATQIDGQPSGRRTDPLSTRPSYYARRTKGRKT